MSATLVSLPPGTVIDGWKVVGVLGNGGFAVVYLVEKQGKLYALKLARHRQSSGDEKQTHARTLRELAVLLMLGEHPNIVQVCGLGYWPDKATGNVFLVLEYIEGWTLAQWVERKHPTAQEALGVFVKLAGALAHMHTRGVLHRDLKLANVLIRKSNGEPVIIDFGCASHALAEDLTEAGLPPGTDRFRAPEQFKFLREHKEEHRARYAFQVADEIFAFGAMFYEVLTDPRPSEERLRVSLNSNRHTPPPAREVNPRVPEALSDLVESLLARDPARRPVDTDALRREVAELAALTSAEYLVPFHLPSEQRQPAPAEAGEPVAPEPPSPIRWAALRAWVGGRVRSRKVLVGGGLVAAAVTAAVLAFLLRPAEVPRPAPSMAATPAPSTAGPVLPSGNGPAMSPPSPAPAVDISPAAAVNTQKEGSTVSTQKPEAPRHSRPAGGQKPPPTPALCKTLPLLAAFLAGCPGVQVRPEPFECPEQVQKVMFEKLGWDRNFDFHVALDDRFDVTEDPVLHPGEVVGLATAFAASSAERKKVPTGTQFRGRLYVSPDHHGGRADEPGNVIVKYDRVKLPGQDELPVCLIAISRRVYSLEKDGGAKAANSADANVVTSYP
jgi:tRNA A-37 threonylcarbamoyl transferase component Bud32